MMMMVMVVVMMMTMMVTVVMAMMMMMVVIERAGLTGAGGARGRNTVRIATRGLRLTRVVGGR